MGTSACMNIFLTFSTFLLRLRRFASRPRCPCRSSATTASSTRRAWLSLTLQSRRGRGNTSLKLTKWCKRRKIEQELKTMPITTTTVRAKAPQTTTRVVTAVARRRPPRCLLWASISRMPRCRQSPSCHRGTCMAGFNNTTAEKRCNALRTKWRSDKLTTHDIQILTLLRILFSKKLRLKWLNFKFRDDSNDTSTGLRDLTWTGKLCRGQGSPGYQTSKENVFLSTKETKGVLKAGPDNRSGRTYTPCASTTRHFDHSKQKTSH